MAWETAESWLTLGLQPSQPHPESQQTRLSGNELLWSLLEAEFGVFIGGKRKKRKPPHWPALSLSLCLSSDLVNEFWNTKLFLGEALWSRPDVNQCCCQPQLSRNNTFLFRFSTVYFLMEYCTALQINSDPAAVTDSGNYAIPALWSWSASHLQLFADDVFPSNEPALWCVDDIALSQLSKQKTSCVISGCSDLDSLRICCLQRTCEWSLTTQCLKNDFRGC